jgi:hypothetical protein
MARKPKKEPKQEAKSIISADWRERTGGNCGDDLSIKLAQHLGNGEDWLARLVQLAEANDVWDNKYSRLNPGQQRMVVGNRLRKLLNAGEKIKWGRSYKTEK